MTASPEPRFVLVGWDGADWNLINPLLDTGQMPNLQRLIERGVMGSLATLEPAISPMLWTTIATGVTADRHGILGFVEPDPVSGGVRPVGSGSRKVKAIWNILHQSGKRSIVVDWFASHPAEPVNGLVVSNAFATPAGPVEQPWPVPPGSIHPVALASELAQLRVHPTDFSGNDLALFVPELAKIDQKKDRRLLTLAAILAESVTHHGVFTWALEHQPWDFAAVYCQGIDLACHDFMAFHPPLLPGVDENEFEIYQHVIDGIYRYYDLMLGRVLDLAGPDATVMLISDHGFKSGARRPRGPALVRAETPLMAHRSHGVFCMAGPGIRHDELVYGASLLDITPTILAAFGLPAGEEMPGRPLLEAWEAPPEPQRIPSWEGVPGDSGRSDEAAAENPWDAAAALQQLVDLGYVEPLAKSEQKQVADARYWEDLLLARLHLAGGRAEQALPLLQRISEERPEEAGLRIYLARCYQRLGRLAESRELLESVLRADGDRPMASILMGELCLTEGKHEKALACFAEASETERREPVLHLLVGRCHLLAKRAEDAERSFRKALEIDPDLPRGYLGLAAALLDQDDRRGAADAALTAIGLKFELAAAHYILGVSLAGLGEASRAAQSLETCLRFEPENRAAQARLSAIRKGVVPRNG